MWWSLVTPALAVDPQELDAVVRALSARDPISCEVVEALTSTPAETLLTVVDTVTMPPWAPMVAADCLVERHPTAVRDRLDVWVTDPGLKGLGRIVLNKMEKVPLDVAVAVGRKAIASGPEPEVWRARLALAQRPEVRALAAEPAPDPEVE